MGIQTTSFGSRSESHQADQQPRDREMARSSDDETPPRAWWIGIAILLIVLSIPLLAVDVPPLTDYPNHLARSYILAVHSSHPLLDAMFAPAWHLIPNLAMDLLLPPLMLVLPPLVAGKMLLLLTALLPVTGAIALGYASLHRRSFWQLGAGLVAYNALFIFGFINFHLAVGAALWSAAAWIYASTRRPWAAAIFGAAAAFLCFIFHLFGFLLFALLIGSHEAAVTLAGGLRSRAALQTMVARGIRLVIALLPTALVYFSSTFAQTTGPVVRHSPSRLLDATLPILSYSRPLALVTLAVLTLLIGQWLVRRRLQIAPLAWVAVPVLIVLYFALPFGAKGGFWIDSRVPVVLGFLLFAAMAPWRIGRREGSLVLIALAALLVLRIAHITDLWIKSQQDIRDVRSVLSHVPNGSRLISVAIDPLGLEGTHGVGSRAVAPITPQSWWQLPAFAVIDRQAYWPGIFAYPGQQPLVNRPPFDQLGDGLARAPFDYRALAPETNDQSETHETSLADWQHRYDYVLLLNSETSPPLQPPLSQDLQEIDHRGFATLYRVQRPL